MRLLSFLALLSLHSAACGAEPVSLFDGRSLDGWDYNPAMWRIEDGVITGGSTREKIQKNDFISTQKSYQNFELKLRIKVSGDPKTGMLNSGIQIRSVRTEGGAMSGYQVDCGAGWFGKIYDEHRRNKVIWSPTPEQQAALDKAVDVFGWNEYRIRAEGPRIQTWINGVHCIDYTETDPNIAFDGHIAPQVHSGGVCLVQVKDVTIEELPPTPGAPTWQSVKRASAPMPRRDISYNNVQGSALSAQEQLKKFHLPDGYEIELVVQESDGLGKFVSVYFDHRGRLWTQTALEYPVDSNENPAAAEAVYAGKGKDKILVYPREALNAKIPAEGLTNPTVFAEGLAIPLGILPWGNGDRCYVQHGHDLKLYEDSTGDGKADTFKVLLTGFGVQDSHLFPHQFTRAPGGWIWMAQGLFNFSKVHRPGSDHIVDWPKCSMARMRPDGSEFEVISTGPNNIWGLVINGEGEAFIQEANDYGYPVMPFHEYAYYPGGMEALKKSYQPDFPPQAEFRMGGTGLSGLAFIEAGPLKHPAAAHTLAVANPITSQIQTLAMHREQPTSSPAQQSRHLAPRDEPSAPPTASSPLSPTHANSTPPAPLAKQKGADTTSWRLEQLPNLITCDDPFFRPVALTNGPDGCLYIVDWYNKIISHNEVPRAHPDRDKTRGRIWRVKPVAKTSSEPPASSLVRPIADFTQLDTSALLALLPEQPMGAAHLAWQELADRQQLPADHFAAQDYGARTPFGQIVQLGRHLTEQSISALLAYAKPSLPGPTIQSSRANKQIPAGAAYEREFERYLVRLFLERQPSLVASFLDGEAAAKLPIEARVLASLALEPKQSASRVAKLLPQLDRAPNEEELLRLAQFPAEAGVGEALQALLTHPQLRASVAEKLLAQRTKLDARQIAPRLIEPAREMLQSSDEAARSQALALISGFQLAALEGELIARLKQPASASLQRVAILHGLRDLRSAEAELFASLASTDPEALTREAAFEALAASRAAEAGSRLLALYPKLPPAQRLRALQALSSSPQGARSVVAALLAKSLPQEDLDGPTVERLATVLGDDPALQKLQQQLGGIFREVLLLDGQDSAWVQTPITLDGPFTVEAWVRLAPGIGNEDCLLGTASGLQLNFFQSKFRAYAGSKWHDVCVAKKPMTPELWTHLAVTRDELGILRIYQNGELDAEARQPVLDRWENCRIGWSGPSQGTQGAFTEFRVWKKARSAAEIRSGFDRSFAPNASHQTYLQGGDPLGRGARLAKTLDTPPLLTEAAAKALDARFAKLSALALQGHPSQGKNVAALCLACHQIGNAGGQIGPNLSGVGAMGLEAILRNILTPNAAMEPGYRIYRVRLKSGDLIDAFFVSEDKEAIVIRQPGNADRRIAKAEVASTQFIRRSLMPEGLLDALPDQTAADLLAYLMTLKG